jgi:hypothetical protein
MLSFSLLLYLSSFFEWSGRASCSITLSPTIPETNLPTIYVSVGVWEQNGTVMGRLTSKSQLWHDKVGIRTSFWYWNFCLLKESWWWQHEDILAHINPWKHSHGHCQYLTMSSHSI